MKTKVKTIDFTTGSVTWKLMSFALTIFATNLLQYLYNAMDSSIVGKFAQNGELALAAVGASGAISGLIINLFIGLSIGANVICSNLRGAAKPKALRRAMHTSVLLAMVCGVLVAVAGIFLAEPLLTLMKTPKDVIKSSVLYMRIYFVGVPFSLVFNFGSAIMRAHGDTNRPMIILLWTGLINVLLNFVFVVFLGMDVDGVGWATVIAQAISAIVVMWILFKPDGGYDLNFRELKIHSRELWDIVRVGVPSGINSIILSFTNTILQSSVNGLGGSAMAGNTASDNLTSLVYRIGASFQAACISFGGQCYGAAKYKRIDKMLGRSICISAAMNAVVAIPVSLFPAFFLGLFTNSSAAIVAATPKLVLLIWTYIIHGVGLSLLGTLQSMRHTAMPTVLNVFCSCATRVIWALVVFPMHRSLGFLFLCYPISWSINSIALSIYYWNVRRKLDRKERLAIQ